MKHFLLTRFNVNNEHANSSNLPQMDWLENRLEIFSQVTLPSIVAQVTPPDFWLIFLNIDTPNEIRKRLDSIIKNSNLSYCQLCYVPFFNSNVASQSVGERLDGSDEWLLTTRLDNDDALHPSYIDLVIRSAVKGRREFLNVTQGLIFAGGKAYRKQDFSNPFITLSEPASENKTVWIEQHHRASRYATVRQIKILDGWIQYVHGGNLANQIRGVYAPYKSINQESMPEYLRGMLFADSFGDRLIESSYGLTLRYCKSLYRRLRTEWRDKFKSNFKQARRKKVVIFQYRLLHYRVQLFENMRNILAKRGIDLQLVYGQASLREVARKDEGNLPWAYKVRNHYWQIGERDILWQPFPSELKDADLVVVMQENRILSNYPILLSRLWSSRKLAYWGHGRNFQSQNPSGLREKWKNFMIGRVDWWFAYTQMTVGILRQAGFPQVKITCLDNAIDTHGFKSDLASWSEVDVAEEKIRLGISPSATVGLFCGSLYLDKRLDLLIKSSDIIHQQVPDFVLIVIGDGPSMELMREAAESRSWLHLLGVRKGLDKALYFRMGDLMLNPGLVGLHIVDAFCSSLVMITTSTARHSPEVAYLRDGENGVYAGDTPDSYSQAVIDIIKNPERLINMKKNAFADSERYTLENMVKHFADGIEMAVHD